MRALRVLGRTVLVGRLARLGKGKRSRGTGAATEAGELVEEESEKKPDSSLFGSLNVVGHT